MSDLTDQIARVLRSVPAIDTEVSHDAAEVLIEGLGLGTQTRTSIKDGTWGQHTRIVSQWREVGS